MEILAKSALRSSQICHAGTVPNRAPSHLPGFHHRVLERSPHDAGALVLRRDVHRLHYPSDPVRGTRPHHLPRRVIPRLPQRCLHASAAPPEEGLSVITSLWVSSSILPLIASWDDGTVRPRL